MDRRLFNRIKVSGATVQFRRSGNTKLLMGLSKPRDIVNISKSGLSFFVDRKVDAGENIYMKLNFPDGQNLDLRGQIRWHNHENDSGGRRIGVQFAPYGTSRNYNSVAALDYLRRMEGQQIEKPQAEA